MRVLVIGATGNVGSRLVPLLHAAGCEVVAAARRPGPGGIALDLADPEALRDAARGCAAAYLTTPIREDEPALGAAAVDALAGAGARIVYLSIMKAAELSEIPHFASKVPIERAVLAAGGVALAANFFQENDLLGVEAIRHGGLYPMPIGGVGVANVAVHDIARAAARALTRPDWDGQAVPLCGPHNLTGPELAANWSAALGRPVQYPGDAIEPFVSAVSARIPMDPWLRADFAAMMAVTLTRGNRATPADRAASEAIVGGPLRSHADFTAATALAWADQPQPEMQS